MTLRARWTGLLLKAGDYLMSPTRPRFAYRVSEVIPRDSLVRWDPARKTEFRHIKIVADRVPLGSVPMSARVHQWKWDKRSPRRATAH